MLPDAWSMSDAAHRKAQRQRLYEDHIAPITRFVDRLRLRHGDGVPYVDPDCGGTEAKLLFVLRRPGPRAAETQFLSGGNPDQTARNHLNALAEIGVPYDATMMWNIVPWYGPVGDPFGTGDLELGTKYLSELLAILPQVRSVLFVGRDAQNAIPAVALPKGVRSFCSPHPSPQNLNTNPAQRKLMVDTYRRAWIHACGGAPSSTAPDENSFHSSTREKVLEHIFLGDMLRHLWRMGARGIEVLRAEVDRGGYDLVMECNGVLRHIQLKASHLDSATSRQNINLNLAGKPSGCVVWVRFDKQTMDVGPFLWFGAEPGKPLPPLGDVVARHTKADSSGHKAERPNLRVVNRARFRELADMGALVRELFGLQEPA